MIRDTRSGNWSCDRSGDFSPTFSMFVYVCWCLFTYVWSLDLFGKLYIVLMLREPTSLSFNIDFNTPILSLSVWGRPGDWGASLYAEPKSATWGFIWTMGEPIVTTGRDDIVKSMGFSSIMRKSSLSCLLPYHSLDFYEAPPATQLQWSLIKIKWVIGE